MSVMETNASRLASSSSSYSVHPVWFWIAYYCTDIGRNTRNTGLFLVLKDMGIMGYLTMEPLLMEFFQGQRVMLVLVQCDILIR